MTMEPAAFKILLQTAAASDPIRDLARCLRDDKMTEEQLAALLKGVEDVSDAHKIRLHNAFRDLAQLPRTG